MDYSAHIGHMFASSRGTSQERAQQSLSRIGPSVLNAILSTLLAVVVLAFSKSFVFVVFFRALCLTVVIGGAHGVVFLPAALSVVGGDYLEEGTTVAMAAVGVADSDNA